MLAGSQVFIDNIFYKLTLAIINIHGYFFARGGAEFNNGPVGYGIRITSQGAQHNLLLQDRRQITGIAIGGIEF
jgi:hypothetical protein